jgi:demethylmenaquinone methyltransferase/2-methoxy-6-polyprenyl-1,4-benzoquinol methylase
LVIAADISEGMLEIAKQKIEKRGLSAIIRTQLADSMNLPFESDSFDAITVGFGVRNFEDPALGIREMLRVLRPGGRLAVLEFSEPVKSPFRQLYGFYFRKILPGLGKLFSRNPAAYQYLPDSVGRFPARQAFTKLLTDNGFRMARFRQLSMGIACIYVCEK